MKLFCGDALCKRPVEAPPGGPSWPVRCPSCGAALYPSDVLARLPPNDLEPKRAELMTARGATRVSIASRELSKPGPGGGHPRTPRPADADADADRILGMADVGPGAKETPRTSPEQPAPARTGVRIAPVYDRSDAPARGAPSRPAGAAAPPRINAKIEDNARVVVGDAARGVRDFLGGGAEAIRDATGGAASRILGLARRTRGALSDQRSKDEEDESPGQSRDTKGDASPRPGSERDGARWSRSSEWLEKLAADREARRKR